GSSLITFTALPANGDGPCTVTITVIDANGVLKNAASLTINVNAASALGSAAITANLDTYPVISGLGVLAPATAPIVKNVALPLFVTASDSDGDALNYAWSLATNTVGPAGPCVGTLAAANTALPSFTLDPNAPANTGLIECTFTVTVNDGLYPDGKAKGGVITNTLSLPISGLNNTVMGAPIFGYDYQSSVTIKGGQVVALGLTYNQGCSGGKIDLSTVVSDGTPLGAWPTTLSPLDPTQFTTTASYTAPAGAENDANPVTITATAACDSNPALTSTHVFTLIPLNDFCLGKADTTPCTTTAQASNACVQTATCQGGVCVATSQVTCGASGDPCNVNTCITSPTDAHAGTCQLIHDSVAQGYHLTPAIKTDSTPCANKDTCTTGSVCGAGTCSGSAVVCPAATGVNAACEIPVCTPTTPTHTCGFNPAPSTTVCDDGNACTGTVVTAPIGSNPGVSADYCDGAGTCVGATKGVSCPSGDVCTPVTGSDTQYTCPLKVCMQAKYAVSETVPSLSSLAVGPSGEVWTVGSLYAPGWDFGNGTVLNSSGDSDAYLVKLDPTTGKASTTTPAVFGFGDGGANPQSAAGVAVSQSGTVNVIGSYLGEIDFDPNAVNALFGGTSALAFYATFAAGSTGTVAPTYVAAHAVDLGNGSFVANAANPFISGKDYFVVCGNADKAVGLWNAPGKGAVSPAGLLKPTAATYAGGLDIVVAVINASDGSVVWGKQFGKDGDETCESAAIDNNGDVIIAGNYGVGASNTTVDFGGGSLANKPAAGNAYLYVAKLGGADGHFIAAGGWGSAGRSDGTGLAVDPSNNIVLAGAIAGNVDFGGGVSIVDAGLTDAFVAKFNSALVAQWAKSFGDSAKDQSANAAACDSSGNIYLAGAYQGSLGSFIGLSVPLSSNPNAWSATLAPDGSVLECAAQSYGVPLGTDNIITMAVARTAPDGEANAVFFGGSYSSSMTIGSTTLNTGSGGKFGSFVARLTP
ncbi:MAG: hypothetical protein WCG85_03620, partial [Polyangia bacterium]